MAQKSARRAEVFYLGNILRILFAFSKSSKIKIFHSYPFHLHIDLLEYMIRKLDAIYTYVKEGCQLFLLENGYKVNLIFITMFLSLFIELTLNRPSHIAPS